MANEVIGPDNETRNKNSRTREIVASFIAVSITILFIIILGCAAFLPEKVSLKEVMPYLTGVVGFILGKYFNVRRTSKNEK